MTIVEKGEKKSICLYRLLISASYLMSKSRNLAVCRQFFSQRREERVLHFTQEAGRV